MNIIERQTELGRSLFEINQNAIRSLAEVQRENFEKYIATNREFGEKLPEIREVTDFVSLQREYGETLWNNAREAMETQGEILKSAFDNSREVLETAFRTDEEAAPAPKKKAKAKAKAAPAAAA